jgi:hypothetical protein
MKKESVSPMQKRTSPSRYIDDKALLCSKKHPHVYIGAKCNAPYYARIRVFLRMQNIRPKRGELSRIYLEALADYFDKALLTFENDKEKKSLYMEHIRAEAASLGLTVAELCGEWDRCRRSDWDMRLSNRSK